MKHVRRQNRALVSFIGYKGTVDWLWLVAGLKIIADRLILYPNHRSIERTNERTKLLERFQEYEGCLSAAIELLYYKGCLF